jgi:hypothetical protein
MDKIKCACGTVHSKYKTSLHLKSKTHLQPFTCECGSKYQFKNQMRKEVHERSYRHCKYLNHKYSLEKSI